MGRTAGEEIGELGGKLSPPMTQSAGRAHKEAQKSRGRACALTCSCRLEDWLRSKATTQLAASCMYVGCYFNCATKTNMSSFKSGLCLFYCLYLTNPSVSCVSLTSAVPLALFIYLIRIDLIAL